MSEVVIRRAEVKDLPGISEVNLSAFGNHSYPYSLRQNFDLFGDSYFVAVTDGRVAGFCLGAARPGSDKGWILDLGVLEHMQGDGLGARLLAAVKEALREMGVRRLYLTTNPDKTWLSAFYERNGFVKKGIEDDYFGPGMDRLVMKAAL